jgi:uncharacterized protein YkwD
MIPFRFALATLLLVSGMTSAQENRTADDVRKKLAEILAPPEKKPANALAADRAAALRRLNAYRYLAGLPHDVALDDDLNDTAQAGAALCERIGRLDHTPANPGLPDDEYRKAYRGTSRANLGQGFRSLERAIDGWMDDSAGTTTNILGHRRWCLNPPLQKTGFGHAGPFTSMSCFDTSRTPAPDYDFIPWPGRGPIPVGWFLPSQPWSVSLNPAKYQKVGSSVKPKVWELDPEGKKKGEPLPLALSKVDTAPFGIPNCVIFRPAPVEVKPGKRYLVEIEGAAPRPVRFEVEFIAEK